MSKALEAAKGGLVKTGVANALDMPQVSKDNIWHEDNLPAIKEQYAPNAPQGVFNRFVALGRLSGASPYLGEIYMSDFGGGPTPYLARNFFLRVVQQQPDYKIVKDDAVYANDFYKPVDGELPPGGHVPGGDSKNAMMDRGSLLGSWAQVETVDGKQYFASVLFEHYNTGKSTWKKIPETMIKKVAVAHACRKAFSALHGVYTDAELPIEQARDADFEVISDDNPTQDPETGVEQPRVAATTTKPAGANNGAQTEQETTPPARDPLSANPLAPQKETTRWREPARMTDEQKEVAHLLIDNDVFNEAERVHMRGMLGKGMSQKEAVLVISKIENQVRKRQKAQSPSSAEAQSPSSAEDKSIDKKDDTSNESEGNNSELDF